MTECTITRRVAAPAERVFAAMTDLEGIPERVDAIERVEVLSEGPVGVGTRFRETRIMFKREATEEMEFTAFEPSRFYRVECTSCGAHFATDFTLVPDGDATNVEVVFRATPLSRIAKLMSPLSRFTMGFMRKCIENDIEAIERSLAAEHGQPSGSPNSEDAG